MAINFFNSLAVGTNVLYVDTLNDRVGIGTTNPTRQLTIFDSTGARLALTSGSSANCNILFGDTADDNKGSIRFANSNSSFEHRASIFDFQAQGSSALYINSSRNVGIGTSSPQSKLQIVGKARSSSTVSTDAATTLVTKDYVDAGDASQVTGTGTTNTLSLWSDGPNGVLSDSVVSEETGTAYGTTKNLVVDGNIYQSNMGTSVSIGENALANGTAGTLGENVAIGKDSLNSLTTGTNNIGIGVSTLSSASGNNNIAVGKNSLQSLTGIGNLAFGFDTLGSLTTSDGFVAIGHMAADSVTVGGGGAVVIGNMASKAYTGSIGGAVVIGENALQGSTVSDASESVIIGHKAAQSSIGTTAVGDVVIGTNAFQLSNSGGSNIIIGHNAYINKNAVSVQNAIHLFANASSALTDSYAINIGTYDINDAGIGDPLRSEAKYGVTIGGIDNINEGEQGAILGGKSNTIASGATNAAILGGFDNSITSVGSAGMALGSNLQVQGANQVVVGRYNTGNNNSKFIVGAGFSGANRINAFEVKNTSQLKLGKYGGTQFAQPGATYGLYNLLTVSTTGNVNEVPVSDLNPQNLEASNYTVNPGDVVGLPAASSTRLVKISWGSVNNGTAIVRLPVASNFSNKTIQIITDGTFDVSGGKKISIEASFGSGDTIDGGASFELSKKYEGVTLWSDGTEWFIIQAKAH